ncbi:membrane protein [Salmonella enterica subsp. enterica serovar Pullorum]|nr:membrane protein [Salmonella enterica subsp. enterica serovar Pullorum]
MNETIAFRPEGRASIKDVVVNYTLASLDELEQLHPALNLLAHPSIVRGSHDFFVCCYNAGVQHAQAGAAETVAVLPDSLPQERQRSGPAVCRSRSSGCPAPAADAQSFM